MNQQCLKCQHINTHATGDPLEACPACGAIYSRVEQAMGVAKPGPARPPVKPSTADAVDVYGFVNVLRSETLYPTFRGIVSIHGWLWTVLAVLIALGALLVLFTESGSARFLGCLGGLALAVLVYVMGRFVREMAVMVADMSDACVRTAAHHERRS